MFERYFQHEVVLDSYELVVDAAQFAMMDVVAVTVEYIAVSAAEKIASIEVVVVVLVIEKKFAVAAVLAVTTADNFAFFYADADLLDDFRLTDVFVAAEFAGAFVVAEFADEIVAVVAVCSAVAVNAANAA